MVTHGENREIRDADAFSRAWAESNGLDARARIALAERLNDQVTWTRALRRAAIVGRKVGASGPHWEQALRMVHEQSAILIQKSGRMDFVLQVDELRTPEGFVLPWTPDEDLESHVLYCLARDGVVSLTLMAGLAMTTVTGIVELIARDGRRPGHNAFTWLWSMRDPCVSVRAGSWLTPHTAHSLAAYDQVQASYRAYLRVLTSVDPNAAQATPAAVTLQEMSSLPDAVYDPERGHRVLRDGLAPGELIPPSPRTRTGFAVQAADAGQIEQRFAAISSHMRGS